MAKKKASRDELIFLEDISDCIGKIEEYVTGLTEREFEESTEKQDAVIRRKEIIGEAVKKRYQTRQRASIPTSNGETSQV